MPLSKKQRERLLTLCGQLNEDDAVDPREYFRKKYRSRDSKSLRLCKQVADTLSLVLSGDCADDGVAKPGSLFCAARAQCATTAGRGAAAHGLVRFDYAGSDS